MILLDTDICIELLRGNKKIIEKRTNYDGDIGISFMTAAELYYGAESSAKREENQILIEQFFLTIEIIHTDNDILKKFGELKASLKREAVLIPDADILIASTCLTRANKLVTGNVRHFERIIGLTTENWTR